MKIGFDISMLVYRGSGVATHTYNVVKNLLKSDKNNKYVLFYSSLRRPKSFNYLTEFRKLGAKVYNYRIPPSILKIFWNKWHILPVEWLIGKVDVYHSSDFLRPPLLKNTLGITSIHDLTWKIFPYFHNSEIIIAHEKKMKKTIKYKDAILTISKNTKRDLKKYYPNIEKTNKIIVNYEGVDDRFKQIKNKKLIKKVLKKYKLKYPANYLLYVGAIEPRKNLITAIKVFNQLIQIKKYSKFKFLIVGRAGWKNEKVFQCIDALKLNNKVIFVGYVEDKDLPYFYSGAKAVVYLSLYEGFGLPPVEAARCKIPSLIYKNSSLKEIFPKNYPFAKKGGELNTLTYLIENASKIDYGFTKKFSWKNYCAKFISLYPNQG